MYYASGTIIRSFPSDGVVFSTQLLNQGAQVLKTKTETDARLSDLGSQSSTYEKVAILGMTNKLGDGGGRIGVYGDSNCLDSAHMKRDCYWLLDQMISNLNSGEFTIDELVTWEDTVDHVYKGDLPVRLNGNHLYRSKFISTYFNTNNWFRWSRVLENSLKFEKKIISPCPTSTWVTPKPNNNSFVDQTWKHRPLLAIDLDPIDVIQRDTLPNYHHHNQVE